MEADELLEEIVFTNRELAESDVKPEGWATAMRFWTEWTLHHTEATTIEVSATQGGIVVRVWGPKP